MSLSLPTILYSVFMLTFSLWTIHHLGNSSLSVHGSFFHCPCMVPSSPPVQSSDSPRRSFHREGEGACRTDGPGWGGIGHSAPNHRCRPALWLGLDSMRSFPWGGKGGDPDGRPCVCLGSRQSIHSGFPGCSVESPLSRANMEMVGHCQLGAVLGIQVLGGTRRA